MSQTVAQRQVAPTFGLWYSLRNPQHWRRPFEDLYRESVEQLAWAEQIGFDTAWISEHHFEDDGYASSPLMFLSAVAARTSRLRLGTDLIVAPLHHPLRLAEDAAALAIVSEGRFDLGLGVGYRETDFAAFGQSLSHRPSVVEEMIAILRQSWTGQPVQHSGKRFQIHDASVTPVAARPPRLVMGGEAVVAVERAARLADAYLPPAGIPLYFDRYLDAVEKVGRERRSGVILAGHNAIISEDPERTLATAGEHWRYQVNGYLETGGYEGNACPTPEAALESGWFQLWDADTAVEEISQMLTEYPQIQDVHWWAQFPGESIDSGSERLQYIADNVLPRLRERFASADQVPAVATSGA